MSNRKKDGDFNLDEELRNNIIASEDGQILSDDHEDEVIFDDETSSLSQCEDIQEAKKKLIKK